MGGHPKNSLFGMRFLIPLSSPVSLYIYFSLFDYGFATFVTHDVSSHMTCRNLQVRQTSHKLTEEGRKYKSFFFNTDNIYILLDGLVCSIVGYFYESRRILASP